MHIRSLSGLRGLIASTKLHIVAGLVLICVVAPQRSSAAIQVIVDDQDGPPGFTTTGDDWATWGTAGNGFSPSDTSQHYLSHTVGGPTRHGTATWTPVLPCKGIYQISTWFRRTESRTRDADHFIYDGLGGTTHIIIDQFGDGPSGWVPLGEYFCQSGFDGCSVVLDGTDDNYSDAANAMRFTLVACDGDPDESVPECPNTPEPGVHEVTAFASTAWTSAGWSDVNLATGPPDGLEAQIGNLDEGEQLFGSGWALCNPPGDETIISVEISCRGRTQYASGTYDVLVELSAGGSSATQWHHTNLAWDSVDVTADRGDWSWFYLNQLAAQVGLHSHPGGANDSDVWIDAFRLRVVYETHEPPLEKDAGPSQPDAGHADARPESDASDPDSDVYDDSGAPNGSGVEITGGCDCAVGGDGAPWSGDGALGAVLFLLWAYRRRRHFHGAPERGRRGI